MTKRLRFTEFTDPICTWCWGSEPLIRTLETRYKDLEVRYVMGGLVRNIKEFMDTSNGIGGEDVERSNRQIAAHWMEASQRHGMPVDPEKFHLFEEGHLSGYPQNIAYKAAQMEDEGKAKRLLRRLREATMLEGRQTNKLEVLMGLAIECGLDLGKFVERMTDGTAEKAFEEDLYLTRQYEVRGFPTYLIEYGDSPLLIRGFMKYDTARAAIQGLSGGTIQESLPEKTLERALEFIRRYESVVPVELLSAFDYNEEELQVTLEKLREQGAIVIEKAGNGYMIRPMETAGCAEDMCQFETQENYGDGGLEHGNKG